MDVTVVFRYANTSQNQEQTIADIQAQNRLFGGKRTAPIIC